jgi:hypothetical protein
VILHAIGGQAAGPECARERSQPSVQVTYAQGHQRTRRGACLYRKAACDTSISGQTDNPSSSNPSATRSRKSCLNGRALTILLIVRSGEYRCSASIASSAASISPRRA